MKLDGKLEPAEQTLLNKSVRTIVDQVDAMKRLVNEFRDYARLPSAELHALDLNPLIVEVMQLYGADHGQVPVRLELDESCPPVMADAQQIRQVIHNLLQNAQDATESNPAAAEKLVILKTQWSPSSGRVRLSVIDHGAGFPDNILARAFEPYVTTKRKGTGLGLAVVKKIADEHGSRVDIANRVVNGKILGAQVSLSFAAASKASVAGPEGLAA
jgi:nitrogen fixation/metabolism regulation signal transduction histidine kinase